MFKITKAYPMRYVRKTKNSGNACECTIYVTSKSTFENLIKELSRRGDSSGHLYEVYNHHRISNEKSKMEPIPPEKPVFDTYLRAMTDF